VAGGIQHVNADMDTVVMKFVADPHGALLHLKKLVVLALDVLHDWLMAGVGENPVCRNKAISSRNYNVQAAEQKKNVAPKHGIPVCALQAFP
jgi:hypothetical protein